MIVHHCSQVSPEWYNLRKGIATASAFHRIFKASTGEMSQSAGGYIKELVDDMLLQLPPYFTEQGHPIRSRGSAAMQRGKDLEWVARRWYEQKTGLRTWPVGFCTTDCGRFGCSPDALVGHDGGTEIKIYDDAVHAKWLEKREEVPMMHRAQVWASLWITGREWWDFVAYSETQESFTVRVYQEDVPEWLPTCMEIFWQRYEAALSASGLRWEDRLR